MSGIYRDEWITALARTERYGMKTPCSAPEYGRLYFTDSKMTELARLVGLSLKGLTVDDVVSQSAAIHLRLIPPLQRWLGCPLYLTLGWIDDGHDGIYRFNEREIDSLLSQEPKANFITMHAWLTLPTLEIIDVTLATLLERFHQSSDEYAGVFSQSPDNLVNLVFKPVLVGHELLVRSGLLPLQSEENTNIRPLLSPYTQACAHE